MAPGSRSVRLMPAAPLAGDRVVTHPADRIDHTPARHRPGIVIAALDLVVRVAPRTVVARPQRLQNPVSLGGQTFDQTMRRHLILDPGPDLVAYRTGVSGRPPFGQVQMSSPVSSPSAKIRKPWWRFRNPRWVLYRTIERKVVRTCSTGRTYPRSSMCAHHCPKSWSAQAAIAKLVLEPAPIRPAIARSTRRSRAIRHIGPAPLEQPMQRHRVVALRNEYGQFFPRPQRRQPERSDVHIRTEKVDVVRVALLTLEHAVAICIPRRPDVVDQAAQVRPVLANQTGSPVARTSR